MTNTGNTATTAALASMSTRWINPDDLCDVLTAIHDNDAEDMADLGVTDADRADAAIILAHMTIGDIQRMF